MAFDRKPYDAALEAAFEKYRDALQKLVLKTLQDLSKQDTESTFSYSAGMGVWGFERKGPDPDDPEYMGEFEIEPEPAFSAILDAESEWGYSVVPDGDFSYTAGNLIRY